MFHNGYKNGKQIISFDVDELFDWWDRLDENPNEAFNLFTNFLENAEDLLEVESVYEKVKVVENNELFIEKIKEIDMEDFVPLSF